MPDVNLIIDGKAVTVPAGTNIVDAARSVNSSIPVFCYHPKMKPVGMCRMCLVEVYTPMIDRATGKPVLDENGKPKLGLMMNKLQPGCVTPVSEGMVVKTVSDKVEFAQKGVLEFLLTSHPLDCPICDKGGECPLQNLTMQWGPSVSRFDYQDKVHFEKPYPLGDLIYLDRERCILCSRCVRFQDEIADDPVLGFDNRGRNWEIISKSDPPFDSKYSGNTTDICPVGALTSSDFRFKARVWEVRSTPSICTGCSSGCNITLDMRYDNLMRVMPRENDLVNEIWICDKGRFGQRYIESSDRLTTPLIRRNGELTAVSWAEATAYVAERFQQIRAAHGSAALAGLAGADLPNEDLYVFQKLFREVIGSPNIDHRPGTVLDTPLDDLIPLYGVGAGTDLSKLGKGTAVLVLGADVEEEAAIYKLRLRGIATRGGDLTVANSYPTSLDRSAQRTLRIKAGSEGQLALALLKVVAAESTLSDSFAARLRGLPELRQALKKLSLADLAATTGLTEEAITAAGQAFAKAENGIIVFGRAAMGSGTVISEALANLALLSGKVGRANNGLIALTSGSNARGAHDLGVRPDAIPGGARLQRSGLDAQQIWAATQRGEVKGAYVIGLNPVGISPALAPTIDSLEFLVVQDLFLTETAQLADVVLPLSAIAERDGTFTNAERRVQRFRQARSVPGEAVDAWVTIQAIAQAIPERPSVNGAAPAVKAKAKAGGESGNVLVATSGAAWQYTLTSDIADEISAKVPGYANTTYTSLGLTKKSWGRQTNEQFYYDGTSYENTEGVGIQLPSRADDTKSTFTLSLGDSPAAGSTQGFTLVMPSRLYNSAEWTKGSKLLNRMPPVHAIVSLADATKLGIAIGEKLRIESSVGAVEVMTQIDKGLPEGLVLLPAIRGLDPAAVLSGATTAVSVSKV